MKNSVDQIISDIRDNNVLENHKCFEYAKICSQLLRKPDTELLARRIIINILDNWEKLPPFFHSIWIDLIEASGFYPYLRERKTLIESTSAKIRTEYHRSKNLREKILHEEQYLLKKILDSNKNLIVSAPTSFGKSLLIEEVVASRKYKNIVIIQPTLALLDETRKKLSKYDDSYKIIVRTTQEPSKIKGNLFLLTAERVMEYKQLPNVDFFVIDEFYKLSANRDDERSDVLNNAANLLMNKHKSKFYLLGPNIKGISEGFAQSYNAEFYKTDYSLVDNLSVDIYSKHDGQFGSRGAKKAYKERVLFETLDDLHNEQTLIYCSSPTRARQMAKLYLRHLQAKRTKAKAVMAFDLIDWIKVNISDQWSLIDCLESGIAFHDGALQKHISSTLIDYFNSGKLRYLFCTATIIEGVNTSAKNVIFFDNSKGKDKDIDFFDYSNIKGRSGRMMVHYIGRIFNFNKPPETQDVIIDIPFYEQNPISDEVLIQLTDVDIKNKETEQYKKLQDIPPEEREIFKKTGDLVSGQQKILEILRKDIESNYSLIIWNRFPTYAQLTYALTLGWHNLIRATENVRPMTLDKLVKVTFDYNKNQNIMLLVNSNIKFYQTQQKYKNYDYSDLLDMGIREAFQTLRHWFQYKVPKWLNVVNELQRFVCKEKNLIPGDYSYYASQIENDFIRENLSILMEYGVPNSAIKVLEKHIPYDLPEDAVLDLIQKRNYYNLTGLLEYEKSKLKDLFRE